MFDDDIDRPDAFFFDLESADVVLAVGGRVEGGSYLFGAVFGWRRVDLNDCVADIGVGLTIMDLDGISEGADYDAFRGLVNDYPIVADARCATISTAGGESPWFARAGAARSAMTMTRQHDVRAEENGAGRRWD